MADFKDLQREFEDNWRYADLSWGPYVERAQINVRAHAGSTWTDNERRRLLKEGREPLEIPLIRRAVSFFTGYWRDNATRPVITPVEGSDQQTADDFDEVVTYTFDKGKFNKRFNDGVNDACTAGMSLVGAYMDYSKDPVNGDLFCYKRAFNSYYIDPNTEETDLSDTDFVIMRDYVTRGQAKALLPFVPEEVIDKVPSTRSSDQKFRRLTPNNFEFRTRDMITYDQYYRKVTKNVVILIDHDNALHQDLGHLSRDELARLRRGVKFMRETGEANVEVKTVARQVVELVVLLSGEVVYQGVDATGINERYPFVLIPCYWDTQLQDFTLRCQGIPQQLLSTQRLFNQRHQKIADLYDTAISSGFKYLIGAVEDPDELLQTGQSRLIGINRDDGFDMNSVQELQGGNIGMVGSIIQYQQVLDKLMIDITGANESMFGIDEGGNTQVSGRIAEVRAANGVRVNRQMFDNIEYAQKQLAEIVMLGIQKNYPPEKIARIIGREPTEQFYDKSFEQYDAQVKQGIQTQSQRDAYYMELVALKRDGIVDVPQEEIINALPLVGKSKLEEALQAQQQQQMAQQKKLDEYEQIQKEQAIAKTEQDLALAQERRGRMVADLGLYRERISEASENRAQAALARAKTVTELEKLDDDRIREVYDFVQLLEAQEKQSQQEMQERTLAETATVAGQTIQRAEQKEARLDDTGQQPQEPIQQGV